MASSTTTAAAAATTASTSASASATATASGSSSSSSSSNPTFGLNLRVTAHLNQGGRKYMEDVYSVDHEPKGDEKDLDYAYFGIFDGHGGREAAMFAKVSQSRPPGV